MKACCRDTLPQFDVKDHYKLTLIGNPNVGKSVIFNQLTGANQKIANFPGITISKHQGRFEFDNMKFSITDLPGIYGFTSNKVEEIAAHQFIITDDHDILLNIVDGTKLERNLFLTLQLLEMRKNMILVVNFDDKILERNIDLRIDLLEELLQIPIIRITATDKSNIKNLQKSIVNALKNPSLGRKLRLNECEPHIKKINDRIHKYLVENELHLHGTSTRWMSILSILNPEITFTDELSELRNALLDEGYLNVNNDQESSPKTVSVISEYYEIIEDIVSQVISKDNNEIERKMAIDKFDQLLLRNSTGLLIFVIIMWLTFQLTYIVTAPLSDLIDSATLSLADLTWDIIPNAFFASLLADGFIGGVGFVLVFVPQIALLFVALSFLEHSGYLARVVFITDRFLNKLGISGTSIAPMLLGFGCNVPSIMATKTIQDENERIVAILTNPFLSCSARLPVFIILSGAIFGRSAGFVVFSMYFASIFIAISVMFVLRRTFLKGYAQDLIIELPDLSIPSYTILLYQPLSQIKKFIQNAGTWMALGLIVIWFLSITGPSGYIGPDALNDNDLLENSWIYFIAGLISPIFGPMGWNEKLIVALIFGFIAKEIVIGSLGVLYGVGGNLAALESELNSDFTKVQAIAFMLFVLIYTPCIGTLFAIKQEIGKKWAAVSIVLSLTLAYSISLIVTLTGNLIW